MPSASRLLNESANDCADSSGLAAGMLAASKVRRTLPDSAGYVNLASR